MPDDLTGAALVDAGAAELVARIGCAEDEALIGAHHTIRAILARAGVDEQVMDNAACVLGWHGNCQQDDLVAALLRALAGVLRDE